MNKSKCNKDLILCSACLLGVKCPFDGNSYPKEKVLDLIGKENLIPVCPEQLGGLATPRDWSEIKGKKVVTEKGEDVTEQYERGAKEILKIAKLLNVKKAILKQRSPSCGSGQVYDGSFSDKIIKGDGLTTKLLKENSIEVISEEDL